MPIPLTISKKSIPHGGTTIVRYYGAVKSAGRTSLELLADRISDMCTVTRPDVLAVLAGLQKQVIDTLRNGDGISLGELGTIYVKCHAGLVPTADECTTDTVKSLYVKFKPSSALAKAVARDKVTFKMPDKKKDDSNKPNTPQT